MSQCELFSEGREAHASRPRRSPATRKAHVLFSFVRLRKQLSGGSSQIQRIRTAGVFVASSRCAVDGINWRRLERARTDPLYKSSV